MENIQEPVVAGLFYNKDPNLLREEIKNLRENFTYENKVKAVIVPHAGLSYCGRVIAKTLSFLQTRIDITNVVLIGPAHRYFFTGIAQNRADYFKTPLGKIRVEENLKHTLTEIYSFVKISDKAYENEHCIEVILPFLQIFLSTSFTITPLLVGNASLNQISEVLTHIYQGENNLIIVSSDLSHYENYEQAKRLDQKTSSAILNLEYEKITSDDACGFLPIKGLLKLAQDKKLIGREICLENSGDNGGTHLEVVGYGGFYFFENRG